MLHKTENMITADCILRLLRLDKKLKHIEGIVSPIVDGDKQGYQIKIASSTKEYFYEFFIDSSGYISIYLDLNTLHLLDDSFSNIKIFSSELLIAAKEYLASAIINTLRSSKYIASIRNKYNAL